MKFFLIVLLIAVSSSSFAFQPPKNRFIDSVVVWFDKALLEKDSISLKELLDDNATYGHSNGWIESRRDVVNDLYNGKLTYQQINITEKKIEVSGRVATVRMKADVDVLVSNTPVHVKLGILQVWKLKHKHWVLVARQSVKI